MPSSNHLPPDCLPLSPLVLPPSLHHPTPPRHLGARVLEGGRVGPLRRPPQPVRPLRGHRRPPAGLQGRGGRCGAGRRQAGPGQRSGRARKRGWGLKSALGFSDAMWAGICVICATGWREAGGITRFFTTVDVKNSCHSYTCGASNEGETSISI